MKQALLALLSALWIAGLVAQLGSWPMLAGYLLISLAMAGLMLGERAVLRLVRIRSWRR
jgi:hypothetical protein